MSRKKRACIQCTAVLILALCMAYPGFAADAYTTSRSLFFGGYTGMYKGSLLQHDGSYDTDDRTFNVDAFGGFFVRDNLALGFKAGYSNSRTDLFYQLDGTDYEDYAKAGVFKVGLFMRNYFRLSRFVRFFMETSAAAGFGDTERHNSEYGPSHRETGDVFTFEVGFTPGAVFFINRGLAVEATVGFIGLSYTKLKEDDPEEGFTSTSTDLDFGFNVNSLRIQLGISIYF